MSITSGFFTADESGGVYDREYTSSQFMELFSLFFTSGIFVNWGNEFACTAGTGLSVNIDTGFAFSDGCWIKNSEMIAQSIDANTGTELRVDGIFIKKSITNRIGTLVYASGRVIPERTEYSYELLLCKVNVAVEASQIVAENVIDMRSDEAVCGWVAGAVQQLSTSELYTQFAEEFDAWFQHMKDQLSTDAAGNLQLQVDAITSDISAIETAMGDQVDFSLVGTTLSITTH